jgi:hypothetical protein
MTSPSETADAPEMMQEDDQGMPEGISDPDGLPVPEDPPPPAQAETWHPIGAPAGSAAGSDAEVPVVADQADTEKPPAFPAPVTRLASVPEPSATSATASPDTRWHDVLAMFVDDPRSSVELAAGLVDDDIQELVTSLKAQQDSLLAAWHGEDPGTEELRTAVQQYHTFGNHLAGFNAGHA